MLNEIYISNILTEYGFNNRLDGDPDIVHKFLLYIDLLKRWNRNISLTSITNDENIIRKHFGESLFCLSFVEFVHGRLADVGSGAGFPALPIKLARPCLEIDLYEPNHKKAVFLNEVIRSLGISGASVIKGRIPETRPKPATLSYVTTRAVARHGEIVAWSRISLESGGKVICWVGKAESERLCSMAGWEWISPALIPGTAGSYIVHGSKIEQTS